MKDITKAILLIILLAIVIYTIDFDFTNFMLGAIFGAAWYKLGRDN